MIIWKSKTFLTRNMYPIWSEAILRQEMQARRRERITRNWPGPSLYSSSGIRRIIYRKECLFVLWYSFEFGKYMLFKERQISAGQANDGSRKNNRVFTAWILLSITRDIVLGKMGSGVAIRQNLHQRKQWNWDRRDCMRSVSIWFYGYENKIAWVTVKRDDRKQIEIQDYFCMNNRVKWKG